MTRCYVCFRCISVVVATCSFFWSFHAHAVTTSWNTNSSGLFTTPANWNNGVADSDDTAVFNRGAGVVYNVTFPGGSLLNPPPNYTIDYLRVHSNSVSFVWVDSPSQTIPTMTVANLGVSIVIGENADEVAVLNTTLSSLSGANTSIGRAPDADGTLNVYAGTFRMSGSLDVGDSGAGTLNVTGGRVTSASVNLGQFVGGEGDATVSGVNASLINSGDLTVGFGGLGQLSVTAQGFVFDTDGYLGRNAGSIGTATVSGNGSSWANSGNLYVGQFGTGTLDITSGGAVSVGGTTAVGATSQINVSNNGTFAGTGNLTIDGGSFTADMNANASFAAGTLKNGATATVSGGASVTQSGGLDLVSDVTMEITSGASYSLVTSGGAVVGSLPGPAARLTMDGAGTLLSADYAIDIGGGGTGEMTVTGGARVETYTGAVGSHSAGSIGTLTLDGTDASGNPSSWLLDYGPNMGLNPTSQGSISIFNGALLHTTNLMSLGDSGTAQVVVDGTDGAGNPSLMDVGTLNIGDQSSGTGVLTATAGGRIEADTLAVGQEGTGTLTIQSGASVSSALARIGDVAGSSGAVTVTGAGSTWTNSDELFVGHSGEGTLAIESGGDVSNTNGYIGRFAGSLCTVTVSGAGSSWTNSGSLEIGSGIYATGTLTIEAGASVSNSNGVIATSTGSDGSATVTGVGSTWTNGQLNVGNSGHGTLTVQSGGHVTTTGSFIASNGGSAGEATVTGAGSLWTTNGFLSVGGGGPGTLLIEAGGRVTNSYGTIGVGSTSISTVTVTGAGSEWASDTLDVGLSGTGTLNVQNGGEMANGIANIATSAGSTGTVTVGGVGSTWSSTSRLGVGGNAQSGTAGGMGTFNIGPGGTVNVNVDVIIFPQGIVRLQGGTLDTPTVAFQGSGGQFQWTAGTIHVGTFNGNLLNLGGTLAPGHSAGNTTIVGSYTQQAAAKLEIEIGGTSAGSSYDVANATGTASLSGELRLPLINGFVPSAGDSFTVFSAAGGISGAFSNAPNGKRWFTSNGAGTFVVHYGPGSAFNPNQVRLTDFQPTPIGLVAYEPFDYSPAGADLAGANGGSGFAGPWTAGTFNHDVGTGSLSFADLNTVGNRVTSDALLAGPLGNIDRELTLPLGIPGTTAYLSFVIRPEDTLHQGLFNGFFGLRLFASTGDSLFIGKTGGGALNKWVLEDQGGAQQHASGVDVVVDEEFLLVVRANFNEGNDVFTLYVNPTPGATEPLTGTVKNDSDVGIVGMLGLYSTGAFSLDELRIGTSFGDVVPGGLPGDYNLDGSVDAADYVVWRKGLVASTPTNYNLWRTNFGEPSGSGSGAAANATVPEPSTLVMLIVAAAGWCVRRGRAPEKVPSSR